MLLPCPARAAAGRGLACSTAGRISQALTELAGRAKNILRQAASGAGGAATRWSSWARRWTRCRASCRPGWRSWTASAARLKETLPRYGETLAATHDLRALIGAVLDTAVQATRARGGRLLLYDAERGEATEQARIGTARGSRTDLPMVVPAGRGIEGEALPALEPRIARRPRPMLAVPIVREKRAAGAGHRGRPRGRACSATATSRRCRASPSRRGVAIENARLHRLVEQQARHRRADRHRQPPRSSSSVLGPRVRARAAVRPAAVADHARHRRLQAGQRPPDRPPGRRRGAARRRRRPSRR